MLPLLALAIGAVSGQGAAALSRDGGEFRMTTPLAGDQVCPQAALDGSGGYLVWEDNATDGLGLGISARRLDANLNGVQGSFRINEIGAGDQEKPKVAMLSNGGAAIVWQGGTLGAQRIYARFLTAAGAFATGDIQVNSYNLETQTEPSVAATADGGVVVVWSSLGQDGSLSGVYGQRLSNLGLKLGSEFRVNVSTQNNQRSPVVGGLPAGGFVVAWITERFHRTILAVDDGGTSTDPSGGGQEYDVQLMARRYDASGVEVTGEYVVSSNTRIAANPALAVAPDGSVAFVWGSRAPQSAGAVKNREGWDISSVVHRPDGTPAGPEQVLNQQTRGDQFLPNVSSIGSRFLAVWTSLGQDGSREGVFARALSAGGPIADEMQVNSSAAGQQMFPTVASRGDGGAVVAWSGFVGGLESFDLFAQRIVEAPAIEAPGAPFVFATSPGSLSVSWSEVAGLGMVTYQLYVDGAATPAALFENHYQLDNLMPGSSHSFKLAYQLEDGRLSSTSAGATGCVWDLDRNYDGLPDDWQSRYWPGTSNRPAANVDSDGDGALNFQELLAGTDPTDVASVLKLNVERSDQGTRLVWTTQPGAFYQVQVSTNLGSWSGLGPERLAAGTSDSIPVAGADSVQMFRIIRIR